ncbi:MAG: APC family permease [Chloroflexi bacterium]|nr:APC family permease [Chloroflexota bacterium]
MPPAPDVPWLEVLQGQRPGDRFVRVVRPYARQFRRLEPGHLVATEQALRPRTGFGQALELLRRLLIGRRIPSEQEIQERVGVAKGLAIFAPDNISSSAYATEEIMRVLALAGLGVLVLTTPISLIIVGLLVIVVVSYFQVIRTYPGGGGSYVVARENLGTGAGLVAAAAVISDYILTAAVSTAAGVAALTSAFPELFEQRVLVSLAVLAATAILNLRGVRESGTAFALPTALYIVTVLGVLGYGVVRELTGTLPAYTPPPEWTTHWQAEPLALLLLLRAFSSGAVALTGVEAISNGVPAFKPPEARHAQIALVLTATIFGTVFLGISFLAGRAGMVPDPREAETVLSQVARTVLGGTGPVYYVLQLATAVLLVIATNTAFNGFPRLAYVLARDRFLPSQFQYRGDRLAFNVGIVTLAILAGVLIVAYEGSVSGLIPLYTVGVFLAFTLSQTGLVRRWLRLRASERGWRWRAALNAVGAAATGIVLVVVAVSKFALGAWMVLVLIPPMVFVMWAIHRHYTAVEAALTVKDPSELLTSTRPPTVVVPVAQLNRATLRALAFARSISRDIIAVHVAADPEEYGDFRRRWEEWSPGAALLIIESPYRSLVPPLVAFVEATAQRDSRRPVVVVLAEFLPRHFWEWFLHNQTALRLKLRLFFLSNTIVVDVPYHLDEPVNRLAG